MSDHNEGLDLDLLAAIEANPGISIINISDKFSGRASESTVRRYVKSLADLGLITARKETVLRPTTLGKVFAEKEKCRRGSSEGGQTP